MRVLIVAFMMLVLGVSGTSFGDQKDNIEGIYKGKSGEFGEINRICIVKNANKSYKVLISTIYCPTVPFSSDCSTGKLGSIQFDSFVESGLLKYSQTNPRCHVRVIIKRTKAIVKVPKDECIEDFPYDGASGVYKRVKSTKADRSDCVY